MAVNLRAYPNSMKADAIASAWSLQRDTDDDDEVYAVLHLGRFAWPYRVLRYSLDFDEYPLKGFDGVVYVPRPRGAVLAFPHIEREPVPVEVVAQIALDGWAA